MLLFLAWPVLGLRRLSGFIDKDAAGKAEYGTVLPEMEQPLEVLARMYKDGAVRQKIGRRRTRRREWKARCPGNWACSTVITGSPTVVEKTSDVDKDAKWVGVPLPGEAGNAVHIPLDNATDGYLVVNKNFKHPELVVEMLKPLRGHDVRRDEPIR